METYLVDTETAARRLSLAKGTLQNLRVSGGGPNFVKAGGAVRYRIADLDAWADARIVSSTSDTVAA